MALNSEAYEIAERMIRGADLLHASVHVRAGVRVVDCGVQSPGGLAAGVEMALAAMAGGGGPGSNPPMCRTSTGLASGRNAFGRWSQWRAINRWQRASLRSMRDGR